jgi:hypothetical protein
MLWREVLLVAMSGARVAGKIGTVVVQNIAPFLFGILIDVLRRVARVLYAFLSLFVFIAIAL